MTNRPDLETDLAAFYDQEAASRLGRTGGERRHAAREAFINRLHSEARTTLLEIGTGAGHDAFAFQQAGLTVAGIDLSEEHVRICRDRGIDARQASLFDIPFEDRAFQAGWTMSTLLHVPNDRIQAALDEVTRVLEPGAPLAIGVWGGHDGEEIRDDDRFEPKRFFSSRSDDRWRAILERHGAIDHFEVWTPRHPDDWTYQFAILRTP